jgi:hypothetical protein
VSLFTQVRFVPVSTVQVKISQVPRVSGFSQVQDSFQVPFSDSVFIFVEIQAMISSVSRFL